MVAEINRGSQTFWDTPLTQPLANFGSKVVLASNSPYPSGIKNKFVAPVRLWCVFQAKKLIFIMQNLEDLGANGAWGQNS